ENHAKTREMYTILSAVASCPMSDDDPNVPQKCAALFRAAPGGAVWKNLQAFGRLAPWMKVQTQENGSHRSEDVVEALEWMLPLANTQQESFVVVLDWHSGRLTEEVADCVRRKGHVLLFHGGGCAPFTQVSDAYLHALAQRLVTQCENEPALEEMNRAAATLERAMATAQGQEWAARMRRRCVERRLRNQMLEEGLTERVASSATGALLRNWAELVKAEEFERRRKQKEKEEEEAEDLEGHMAARTLPQKAASDAKLAQLKQAHASRAHLGALRRADLCHTARQRWLQLEFPVDLAARRRQPMQSMRRAGALKAWESDIQHLLDNRFSTARVTVPHLWHPLPNLTTEWAQTLPFDGGRQHGKVRRGLRFQQFLAPLFPPDRF
ncbi:unnamed protein product, partial [Prorocentrum cordatum]